MIFLFFLITYDSLPPLPDLFKTSFLEPPLWIERHGNSFSIDGQAGDFYGLDCMFGLKHLSMGVSFKRKNEWDSTDTGFAKASYYFTLPQFWVKPKISGFIMRRDDKYRLITPSIDFSVTLPQAVVFGLLNFDLWQINGSNYTEEEANLGIIFDKSRYLPQFQIRGVYIDGALKPVLTSKLKIKNFHLIMGSAIFHGFPSPVLEIDYASTKIKLATRVRSGLVDKTLKEYFDFYKPVKYYKTLEENADPNAPAVYLAPVLDETLRVGFNLEFMLDFYEHLFVIKGSYQDWRSRLNIGDDFRIIHTNDIQEASIVFMLRDMFKFKPFSFYNSLSVQYNQQNNQIIFSPEYSALDTLSVRCMPFEVATEVKYLSKRPGIAKMLPDYLIINFIAGVRLKLFKVYVSVYNINKENKEIFDNYFLSERQFAGGIEISHKF